MNRDTRDWRKRNRPEPAVVPNTVFDPVPGDSKWGLLGFVLLGAFLVIAALVVFGGT